MTVQFEHKQMSSQSSSEKRPHWKYTWLATFLVVVASLIFTASNFVVKSEALNSEEVLLVRSILQAVILGVIGKLRGDNMWPSEGSNEQIKKIRSSLVFSGLAASTVSFLCYYAVQQIALGDAMAIVFAAPLFTLLFEWALFQRPKGMGLKVVSSLVLITGVILVIQPPFLYFDRDEIDNITISTSEVILPEQSSILKYAGITAALGAAIIGGLNNISAWYASSFGRLNAVVIAFYSGLGGLFLSVTIGAFRGSNNRIMSGRLTSIDGDTWGWIIFIALLSMIGFWAQTASLQWIDASALSSLKALEILFAYSVQILVMGQTASSMAIIGSSLVMAGVIGIRLAEKILTWLESLQSY